MPYNQLKPTKMKYNIDDEVTVYGEKGIIKHQLGNETKDPNEIDWYEVETVYDGKTDHYPATDIKPLLGQSKRERVLNYFIQNDDDETLLEKMGFLGNENEHLYGDCVKDRGNNENYKYIYNKLNAEYTPNEIVTYFDDLGLIELED